MDEAVRPENLPREPGPRPESAPGDPSTEPTARPPHLADPRALTILTTEHWSLLTARSLVYNEAFSRGGMFLTFLSASLVALGFISQGTSGPAFGWAVLLLLGLDLFVGLATMGRLISASKDDLAALQGMNRLRHAYLEMVPTLEPYFSTPRYDDVGSVLSVYGDTAGQRPFGLLTVVHGLTTMPGLVGVLDAALAGAIAATAATMLGAEPGVALVAAVLSAILLMLLLFRLMARVFMRHGQSIVPRFPPPDTAPPRG